MFGGGGFCFPGLSAAACENLLLFCFRTLRKRLISDSGGDKTAALWKQVVVLTAWVFFLLLMEFAD